MRSPAVLTKCVVVIFACSIQRQSIKEARAELAQLMLFGDPAVKTAFTRIGKENWWTPSPVCATVYVGLSAFAFWFDSSTMTCVGAPLV